MIKQKNNLLQIDSTFTNVHNLFINYLKLISLDAEDVPRQYRDAKERDARERLEHVRQVRQAIKENTFFHKEKQDDLVSTESYAENLSDIQAQTSSSSCSLANNTDDKEKLKLFLEEMADIRQKNELIYGYKDTIFPQEVGDKQLGIGVSERAGYYKKNLESTITRGEQGWSEFSITYDNKFFLNYSTADADNHQFAFNHQSMGCGTFLKAAGKIKIENGQLIISPCSQYLELGSHYIAIIFFVLREKGFIFSDGDCYIANEEGELIPYIRVGDSVLQLDAASYYLDEARFPLAKAIADNKKLSIKSKLSELFLNIDDEVLSTRNQALIKTLEAKKTKTKLKKAILEFLLLIVNNSLNEEKPQEKEIEIPLEENAVGESFVRKETAGQCYNKIINSIQTFQTEHQIDFSFIKNELSSWFFYMSALGFQAESKFEADEKKKIAEELQEIEKDLLKIKEKSTIIPQRCMEINAVTAYFLKFYTEDPLKTCIALLYDYTKGGFFGRFFSGAWNRHHVRAVEQCLIKYKSGCFPDNLSIQDIYRELFKVEDTLTEYSGKRGTLFARLRFCAILANEIQIENAALDLAVTSLLEISEEDRGSSDTVVIGETSIASTSPIAAAVVESMPVASEVPIALDKTESSKSLRKSVVFSSPNEFSIYKESSNKNNSPDNSPVDSSVFPFNMGNY